MICNTIAEALKAAEQAKTEDLMGLYPSACRVMAEYIGKLYRRVPLESGKDSVPVQFVGVYVTQWGKVDEPTDAFIEADIEDIANASNQAEAGSR